MRTILHNLETHLKTITNQYYKLIVIVGNFNSGKTKLLKYISTNHNLTYINVSLCLSEKMLNLDHDERLFFEDYCTLENALQKSTSGYAFDNMEIFFLNYLKRDPLYVFKKLSRNILTILSWPGCIKNNHLIYAKPNHPEYCKKKIKGFSVISIND